MTNKLRDQRPRANSSSHGQGLTSKQAQHLAVQHGWAYSNIGSTRLKMGDSGAAVVALEQARQILEESLKDDTDDPILLDTYGGLADAYHGMGLALRDEPAKRDENYKKAEQFYQSALKLQKEYLVEKNLPDQVLAPRYANLARLYVDTARFDKAEENFKLAVKLQEMGKKSRDLNSIERSALAAALRELAEFYQGREGCYDEAIAVLNKMIAVQEDVTLRELIDHGQEIANSYSDLAQIHAAMREAATREAAMYKAVNVEDDESKQRAEKEKEADAHNKRKAEDSLRAAENALRAATLLQRTAFKLRQIRKSQEEDRPDNLILGIAMLTADLDELGGAYVNLGKFGVAEKMYLEALGYREKNKEQWKSYDKLTKVYREYLKDDQKAEEYKNLLKLAVKDNADVLLQLGALHADDPYDKGKASEAENYYKDALAIFKGKSDWTNENLTLYRLSKLYEKQERLTERDRARKDRIDTMAGYFKQLEVKAHPPPENPVRLVSQYLYAINAVAYRNKSDAEAEGTYRRALEAYDYIKGNIEDKNLLKFYADTLKDYGNLLNKLKKHDEVAKVAEQEKDVRDKLKKLP